MGFSSQQGGLEWSRSLPIGSAKEESKLHFKLTSSYLVPSVGHLEPCLMFLPNLPHILKMIDLLSFYMCLGAS